VVDHYAANIMVVEEGTSQAKIIAHRGYIEQGLSPAAVENIQIPLHESGTFKISLERAEPLIVEDTQYFEGWLDIPGMEWIRSYVCAPIVIEGAVVGFLNLDSSIPSYFKPAHTARLKSFANQAAIAIENATLYRELERHTEFLEAAVAEATGELRQEKDRVEAILNNSPDVVLLLTSSGTIELVNQSFTTLFQYETGEIVGQNFSILINQEDKAACIKSLVDVVENGVTSRQQSLALRADDQTVEIEIALAPIRQDEVIFGVVCTIRDITVLKQVERMKDAFVSNVSHELRTPITSLKLNHSLLQMNPENGEIYLERLGREVDRLNVLIEDLLRLSRLDQGKVLLDLREVNLHTLLAQIVEDRIPLAEASNQTIEYASDDDCPPILVDPGLITQAVSVFLTNAMNYTPRGGSIMVRCLSGHEKGKPWVGFAVEDNGPGIHPTDLPNIFTRFYRGDAAQASGVSGTGLGLSIAEEIISKHEGKIEVESEGIEGKGAIFRVLLPLERRSVPDNRG
jgi:PAS domain S-box-containing protein